MDTLEGLWCLDKLCKEMAAKLKLIVDEVTYRLVPRKWAADKMVIVVNFTSELSIDIAIDELNFVKSEVELAQLVRIRTRDSIYSMTQYYTEYLTPRGENL